MESDREFELNQIRIEHEAKRLKVLEKKHNLMQSEIEKKRFSAAHKEKVIKERVSALKKIQRVKSQKIHVEIEEKQKKAVEKVKDCEKAEVEYVHCLRDKLKKKYAKINVFKAKKHELYQKAMAKRLHYDLRKEKFGEIVNELLRSSNSIERLAKMGVDIADPENIDLNELAQILEGNSTSTAQSGYDSPLSAKGVKFGKQRLKSRKKSGKIKKKGKKVIIRSQSNLGTGSGTGADDFASTMSFTLPSQKPVVEPMMSRTLNIRGDNEYSLDPCASFPVTSTRKISFSMSM